MKPALVQRLNEINRDFYTRFAGAFAESRSLTQSSLRRVLDRVPPGGRVLDLGCGHGRVAHLLDQHRPGARYLGLDFSDDLLRLARDGAVGLERIETEFMPADLTEPGWARVLESRRFEAALALAVLHHIPGYENRRSILRDLGRHLSPAGSLVISTWQFTTNERMRRKIVSWDRVHVDPAGLEAGDHLLNWKRGGYGYRYCHLIDLNELSRLAAESGLVVEETFYADGKEGNLSLFGVLKQGSVHEPAEPGECDSYTV